MVRQIKDIQDISIAIDSWDDVFSDFDPNPLGKRVLSEDFLVELRKRYRETSRGNFLMTIYAPLNLKDENSERIVIKRLKQYFKFRYLFLSKEINNVRKRGAVLITCGIVSLIILTMITYFHLLESLGIELLGIILMPLGWFGIWEGFSRVIEPSTILNKDRELFNKLSKSTIKFRYAGQ